VITSIERTHECLGRELRALLLKLATLERLHEAQAALIRRLEEERKRECRCANPVCELCHSEGN
jgi:hypothetical protein